jgi:tRNA(adenine34) deaminase
MRAPTLEEDATSMRLAIVASETALLAGDMPFGAALAREGTVVHVSRNRQVTGRDVTGHAEVVLIREVASELGRDALVGATVYASGEPCAMCAGAIFWAGVARVVFGATTEDILAALGGPSLPIRTATVLGTARPGVIVDGPVLRDEAVAVLQQFARAPGEPR